MATPGTSEVAREPARAGSTGWFLVLTGCGVALRLVALLLAGDLEPVLDEGAYLYHAACWERFGFHVDSGRWLWAPGYPLFLRVALGAFGVEGVQVAKEGARRTHKRQPGCWVCVAREMCESVERVS